MKNRIAIIGGGDLGQQIASHADATNEFVVVGFFDDYADPKTLINNFPILGKICTIGEKFKAGLFDYLVMGIGYKHMTFRKELFSKLKQISCKFATIIHPTCVIDPNSKIGAGSVLYPGCIIDQGVVIEENVLLNVGCCVAHDTRIGSHSFLSPRVAIAGFVSVGEENIIGINSTIIDNVRIENKVQIGGGSLVIKDIETKGLYVGSPVRFIQK